MIIVKVGVHVLGSIAFAAMQWLILVCISKFLGVEFAGAFSYYLAIFAPLAILCALNLKSVYSADITNKFTLEEYESVRGLFIFIYIGIGSILLAVEKEYFLIGLMIFSIKFVEVCSELIYGVWVRSGEPQKFGYSKILKFIIFLALVFFLITTKEEKYVYLVYPLAFFLGFFIFDLRFSGVKLKFNFALVKSIFLHVFPFVLTSALISLNTSLPRFFIDFYYDKKMMAEFMYLIYFITIATLPLSSIFQAMLPIINKNKVKALAFTLIYAVLFAVLFYFICDLMLAYFYDYYQPISPKIRMMVSLMLIFQSVVVYVNMLYVASMKFKKILIVTLINSFFILFLNYIFINNFGYYGVYYSGALSSFLLLLNLIFNYYIEKKHVY